MSGGGLLHLLIDEAGDLVAHVPECFIEDMLLPLLQHFDGRAHGADDAAANNALRQLEMVIAEELHALIEIEQALGGVVQAGEFGITAIHFFGGQTVLLELSEKSVSE